MASIRMLKKDINILAYDILSKCYSLKSTDQGIHDDQFDEVIRKIVYLRNDLILRTNHPETNAETGNLKAHYRKVREDLFNLLSTAEELKRKKD